VQKTFTSNRTKVELKQAKFKAKKMNGISSNRTKVELKHSTDSDQVAKLMTSNRTKVELKQEYIDRRWGVG